MMAAANKIRLEQYPAYKDSGVEWLGEIPEGWEVKRIKYVFEIIQTGTTPPTGNRDYFDGPISWYNPRDLNSEILYNSEKSVSDLAVKRNEVKLFPKDSILIVGIGATTGKTSYMIEEGTFNQQITGFHSNLECNRFHYYVLKSLSIVMQKLANYATLPILNNEFFKSFLLVCPPTHTQRAIATFLDEKTSKIDQAIAQKEQLIALLKERKQILIQTAVTKGLDPHAKMKDSGVDWIGEIPEGWEVKRLKYLFNEVSEKSADGSEELLSVSHLTGVTPRSEKDVTMFMAEDYSGSKLCQPGDLIFNIMWTWMGALGVAKQTGIVSPSYGIYRQKDSKIFNAEFLENKLKTTTYIQYYNRVSTGLHSSRLRFYSHMFMDMPFAFPSREGQDRIVQHIATQSQKIDASIALQEKQIGKLKEYKAVLIDSVVTGKVKVTNSDIKLKEVQS